jgi:membrane fusion protein
VAGLFRPEALSHHQREWLGSIQLIRPVSLTVLTVFVVLTALAVGSYLTLGEYTRKARVSGYLAPDHGVIRLVAPQAASVLESHVSEGVSVHRGDVLFVLSVGSTTPSGDTQSAVQSSIAARERSLVDASRQRLQLERTRTTALDAQVADMRHEIDAMAAESDLQRQRLALAQDALTQYQGLLNDNFVSSAQVRAKAEDVLGVKAQLQALQRQRAAREREIATLLAQRDELPLHTQAAQGEIDRDLAALAQQGAENEARRRVVVRAPQDGVVSSVLAAPGQNVTPSVAMATLLPTDSKLQAVLFAPSSAVGFVRVSQVVQLRYQAFPYEKFGHQSGEIAQVSRSPLQSAELAGLPLPASLSAGAEPLYRITVSLDRQSVPAYGEAQPLVPGMQLEADVMLDRRRLIEWLFEPVLGIAGRV